MNRLAQEIVRMKDLVGDKARLTDALRDREKPKDMIEHVNSARTMTERMRCYDESAAASARADVDAWAVVVENAVADEEKCRVTPKCMGERLTAPLCEAIKQRRDATQEIARERRNPSGVVDMNWLHTLGERVQDAEDAIATLRAKYQSLTHRPFDERACPK